jgi:tetratricopeptide (TPR) repeat protein
LGLQRKFDEALAVLLDLPSDPPELAVRVLLERGRVLNTSGRPAEAAPLFSAAFDAATAAALEHLAVDALHMMAIVAPASEQDGLNRRALKLAADAVDPRARQWRASLLNNLGWTAFERGDYPDALALFQDALAARLEMGKVAEIQIAKWCIGRTLRAMGRVNEALEIQRALAAEHRAAGTSDQYVDEEIEALTQMSTTPEPGTG